MALLMPETDRDEALAVAERFRQSVESAFPAGDPAVAPPRVSVGAACFPRDGAAGETLLARAAQALCEARSTGGNRVVGWRPERRRHLRVALGPEARGRVRHAQPDTTVSQRAMLTTMDLEEGVRLPRACRPSGTRTLASGKKAPRQPRGMS